MPPYSFFVCTYILPYAVYLSLSLFGLAAGVQLAWQQDAVEGKAHTPAVARVRNQVEKESNPPSLPYSSVFVYTPRLGKSS